ncbi:MAG: type II toxin-antitoxin system HicA family toxin [Sulfuricellaceae bacterium]
MSHKHVNLIRAIFHDPVSGNIHWREIESLLHHLGASVTPTHGTGFRVKLNDREDFLHHPHQSNVCDRVVIKRLRDFLAGAGVSPSSYESDA